MKISTRGRYALRFMVYLSGRPRTGYIPLRDAAGHMHVNAKYLEQIAASLSRAGLIQVMRGSAGGCRLSRSAAQYTALEILQAAEGSLAPTSCLEGEDNLCTHAVECTTLPFWTGFYDAIREYLSSKTLEDIIEMSRPRV